MSEVLRVEGAQGMSSLETDGRAFSDDVRPIAVQIDHLSHAFASRSKPVLALSDVTLSVRAGEFLSIVGPSGCGKSTLLSFIAGLRDPSLGKVELWGEQVTGIRRDVGFIFQKDALLPWRSALDNVAAALRFRGTAKREARAKAAEWLERVGLAGFENSYPHELSGGMRKRVSIASTLVYEPPILLMDEPFSSLDVQTRSLMETDLLDIWDGSGQTVIFVTHDLEEAIGLSDRVIVFSAAPGSIVGDYSVDLPRPRDLLEVKLQDGFAELYSTVWNDLRNEVMGANPLWARTK
jgi:NitT/TauT family transport system ATP-binding protein